MLRFAVDFFVVDFFAVDFFEVVDFFDDDDFFEVEDFFDEPPLDFFEDEDFDDDFFAGTLPPSRRASDNPMAIACLRLVTFLPEPPLFSVPRFRSCIVFSTFSEAFLPYLLAMQKPPAQFVVQAASPCIQSAITFDGASTVTPRRFTRTSSLYVPGFSCTGTRSVIS